VEGWVRAEIRENGYTPVSGEGLQDRYGWHLYVRVVVTNIGGLSILVAVHRPVTYQVGGEEYEIYSATSWERSGTGTTNRDSIGPLEDDVRSYVSLFLDSYNLINR
jgi:hypothetical protein